MSRSNFGGALIGQLGRRGQAPRVVDKRVAEPDPQLGIAGIALDGVLQDSDRILAVAVTLERFGHPQPALRRREVAEEGMTCVG